MHAGKRGRSDIAPLPELSKEIVVRRRYMYGDKFSDTQMRLHCKQGKVKRVLEY